MLSVSFKRHWCGQTVFWNSKPIVEVGQRKNCGAGEGRRPDGPTPSSLEAGQSSQNPQAREGQRHDTQALPLNLPGELHREGD